MAKKHRMTIHDRDGVTVLDLGEIEIWDGADMALLRETLTRQIDVEKRRSVGVDMSFVKYIPSGFFGMLYDWHEKGILVWLYSPQPHVRNMLWFRQFFEHVNDGCHKFLSEPKQLMTPAAHPHSNNVSPWNNEPSEPVAKRKRIVAR